MDDDVVTENVRIEKLDCNPDADRCAKYLEQKVSIPSYIFLVNYHKVNTNIRRIQAGSILEKYRNINSEKTRDGKPLSEVAKVQLKGILALEMITKTCMLLDDFIIFAKYLPQVKGIENLVSQKTNDSKIEQFLEKFSRQTEEELYELFSLPDIDGIVCFNNEEKLFIKQIYAKHFETIKQIISGLNNYRKKHKVAYLKSKHCLPVIILTEEIEYDKKKYSTIVIFEKGGFGALKKHFILTNDELVERNFALLCNLTVLLGELLLNKIHEAECGGFRALALSLYGINTEENERFLAVNYPAPRARGIPGL